MATTRMILQVLETYQKARITFAQTVAEFSSKPTNVEVLHNAGCMQLLRPLLLDSVPNIQQTAALALSRLAGYSEELSEAIVHENILIQLVYSLREQNRYNKRAAASVLRAIAKHSAPLAQACVDAGAVQPLVLCLEEFDPAVKEVGAWAIGHIARHTPDLAQTVVDAGAVPLLVLCVQEPELSLRRCSAATLSDIAKHTPELAQGIVDAGTVPFVAPLITHTDAKLKREICAVLFQIAKHTTDLAEVIVAADIFPRIFTLLKDMDPMVRRNAASVAREVCKHTPELAQLIVATGGVAALVDNVSEVTGNERLPGIMALGYIGAFTEALALTVIASNGLPPLMDALKNEIEDHIKSATAWTLGQVGRHTPNHAKAVAEIGVLPHLILLFISKVSSEDLQTKCKKAFKSIVDRLTYFPALDSLFQGPPLPEELMMYVVKQLSKIIPNDNDARTKFVTSGGFAKVQQLQAEQGSELREYIDTLNKAYPIEIVHYYSPGYSEILLQTLTGAKGAKEPAGGKATPPPGKATPPKSPPPKPTKPKA
ncbi:sperm-associated antigen 6 [Marchantia polymorpha subsp. ruderalis]|uniref:Sperm-associated antigen 6 n=2 Tax=Marchantia polymorpha TaxID=3197 RepID=A0AAF6AX91_MARPO|nr:hypothetical protein MARPO_0022s0126 [Marchantia polymorpha]BBN04375.1 hypothetical protein Mp_3g04050 [Marchantia polymorpha subsp. ruderalis]|eukprot:PTQ44029.1 hypothetical protein MARPO_0022s0126 [Marchantia polymorpha]